MVTEDIINKIFKEVLNKCKPLAQIRSELSDMSQEEKNEKLSSLLNGGEKEWYQGILERLETAREFNDSYRVKMFEDLAFQYERRILDGYKKEDTPSIEYNLDDYELEKQYNWQYQNEIGSTEETLINKQSNVTFSDESQGALFGYFGDIASELNSMLNNGKRWNRMSDSEKKEKKSRYNAIDKSLQEAFNTVDSIGFPLTVFHGGEFDVSKNVGDKVKFKGYTSSSFQENVAHSFSNYSTAPSELFYSYKILLPSSAKGICANGKDRYGAPLTTHPSEQELLLNKGLEATIVDIDYENHLVTIQV